MTVSTLVILVKSASITVDASDIPSVSAPAPPETTSTDVKPASVILIVSLPAPPLIVSSWSETEPSKMSAPAPPVIVTMASCSRRALAVKT